MKKSKPDFQHLRNVWFFSYIWATLTRKGKSSVQLSLPSACPLRPPRSLQERVTMLLWQRQSAIGSLNPWSSGCAHPKCKSLSNLNIFNLEKVKHWLSHRVWHHGKVSCSVTLCYSCTLCWTLHDLHLVLCTVLHFTVLHLCWTLHWTIPRSSTSFHVVPQP